MNPNLNRSRRHFLSQNAAAGTLSLASADLLARRALATEQAKPLSGAGDVQKSLRWLDPKAPNGEPSLQALVKSWITPVEHFYVRSHAPAPKLDLEEFRLEVSGKVQKPLSLALAELKDKFKRVKTTATLTCAGNRRQELIAMKPIKGVPWGSGAAGNAIWEGYRLSDLLQAAGIAPDAKHVWFEGLDQIQRSDGVIPFGGSVPLIRAMGNFGGVPGGIVADTMNGKPLPADHGFPLRTMIPGVIGARSVKWLGKIIVSDAPSPNHYLQKAYKIVKEVTGEAFAKADPIYQFVINSVICSPAPNAEVTAGQLNVTGYALPNGAQGTTVKKVEVSADGGKTWQEAKITSPQKQFCWVLWSASVAVGPQTPFLLARAVDSQGITQPEKVEWNAKGYFMNQWYRTPISVSD